MTIRFLVSLLLTTQALLSQNFSVTPGKDFSVSDKQFEVLFIGSDGNSNYLLRHDRPPKGEYKLCALDNKTSTQNYEKRITLAEEEKLMDYFHVSGKIMLITRVLDKTLAKTFFLLRAFNSATGDVIGEPQVIEELTTNKDEGLYIDLIVKFSPDKKTMLVVLNNRNDDSRRVVTKLYDSGTFKKIWEKQSVELFEKSVAIPYNFLVDNSKNFIYQINYIRPGTKEDAISAVCISPPGNPITNFIKLPTEGKTIVNSNLELFENELICRGQFINGANASLNNAEANALGFFMFSINTAEAKIVLQTFDYLSADVQNKLSNFRPNFKHYQSYYLEKNLYVITHNFFVKDFYQKGDVYTDPKLLYSIEYGKEVIVIKYNADKKLEWMQIIPRNTLSMASVLQVVCTKNIHILYHDTPKNFGKYPDVNTYKIEKWKPTGGLGKGALTMCVTIDKDGVMKRNIVQPAEADTHLMSFEADRLNRNNLLPLKLHFDKKLGIGRIDLLGITD